MPISDEKLAKLSVLGSARPLSPLPDFPKLEMSDAFKARFPEDAANIERYNADVERFFKETPWRRV